MASVQHVVLPSTVNHPWKGSDFIQDARSLYVATGGGTGVWTPLALGQIYFQGTSVITTPTSYTRFAPAADYVASVLAHFVTETDDEVTYTDGQSAYLSVAWSATVSHTNASAREIFVSVGNATVVTGFERTVASATLAQNIETTFSGRYLMKLAEASTFSLWFKVAAGDVTVSGARISIATVL
jgi:hypothetical protein